MLSRSFQIKLWNLSLRGRQVAEESAFSARRTADLWLGGAMTRLPNFKLPNYSIPSILPCIGHSMPLSTVIVDDEQPARDELAYLLKSVGDVDVVATGKN